MFNLFEYIYFAFNLIIMGTISFSVTKMVLNDRSIYASPSMDRSLGKLYIIEFHYQILDSIPVFF